MSDFYVRSIWKELVPAQFLRNNGQPISDINIDAAKATPLFNANGSLAAEQNANAYLIVPKGFNLSTAREFAARARSGAAPYFAMKDAFVRGGILDVQRQYNYADGTKGYLEDPVLAFKNAASFLVGYTTAAAELSLEAAKIGAGYVNWTSNNRDKEGVYSNDRRNLNSMNSGYNYYRNGPDIFDTRRWDAQYPVSPFYDFRDALSGVAGSRK